MPVSVVIVCKNADATVEKSVRSFMPLTNDIVVADTGSTDNTVAILKTLPINLLHLNWKGYGSTKNEASQHAKHHWILSVDADECASPSLLKAVADIDFSDISKVYGFKRLSYLGEKPIRFGDWGNDRVVRLFNRKHSRWDESPVHEKLILQPNTTLQWLNGFLHHFTATNIDDFNVKQEKYAKLMAEKYYTQNKSSGAAKTLLSPLVAFVSGYFFKAGFLDGVEGFKIAAANARYTRLKYRFLNQLRQS